ncbi:TPA: hypothetical protein QCH54_004018 [Enterobacter ludwigii]|nr:hypothetical protein [Enterobacter ludwigii]
MARPILMQDQSKYTEKNSDEENEICGIIMPIANTVGYPDGHWQNVYEIMCESAVNAGFEPNLVSFDDDVGIIQNRIVQNIYSNPIVVCDISSRNPNVMFELGMRLAFDKPTIIIKDDKTPYSFDVSPIEHLPYPSDLRYQSIKDFKQKLQIKIKETYSRSKDDPNHTTFLKHFGTFKLAHVEEKELSESQYITAEIKEMRKMINTLFLSLKNSTGESAFSNPYYDTKLNKVLQTFRINIPVKSTLIDLNHLVEHLRSYYFEVGNINHGANEDALIITVINPAKNAAEHLKDAVTDYLNTIGLL